MEKINFDILSNTELKLKQKSFTDEYEAIKVKIDGLLERLDELDKLYIKCEEVLNKRLKRTK